MNILPKKRWHVRTKENIARVRKDEAEAAEKEQQERQRIETANREARLNILKQKSKEKLQASGIVDSHKHPPEVSISQTEHINLFADLEHAITTTNEDHDKEVREKKEEYEKKIGYLTYLGQDTNEALKKKNWYEVLPNSSSEVKDTYEKLVLKDEDGKPKVRELDIKDGEIDWKKKQHLDPVNAFTKYSAQEVKKKMCIPSNEKYLKVKNDRHIHKKSKKLEKHERKDEKEKKLQKLREARLKREQQEKHRTELFLGRLHKTTNTEENSVNKVKPKYNSQFNPDLARQNYRH